MSANVLDTIKNTFDPEIAAKSAQFLGESETGLHKAWSAIVPAVLSGVVNKANAPYGKQEVYDIALKHADTGYRSSDQIFATSTSGSNNSVLDAVFGNQTDQVINIISSYSAIKTSSAQTLTTYAATETYSQLGRYAREHHLDDNGLVSYLNNHKGPIMNFVPVGLDLSPVFGSVVEEPPVMEHGRGSHAADSSVVHKRPATRTAAWLTPLLLLALIAIAALYFTRNSHKDPGITLASAETPSDGHMDFDAAVAKGVQDSTDIPGPQSKSTVDSLGNYIYNTGTPSSINIGNSGATIQAGSASTEAKLLSFLNDNTSMVDSIKGNWFEFTGVTFKTGSAELTAASNSQLQNFATIAKAYPKSKFKIGGYTDNKGEIKSNITLSQTRAEAVQKKLQGLGITEQLTGAEGYGPEHPIGDNTTELGRAMNRRVAVSVKAK